MMLPNMKKAAIPESEIYRFELTIRRGEDETWEDIENQLTLVGRRLKLAEHLGFTLEREGWNSTLKALPRKPKKSNRYLGH